MKITKTALEFILETARKAHPREFLGLLRAKDDVIIETLIIPGSKFEKNRSSLYPHMVPLDPSIVGSVHSHPGPPHPSRADLSFFEKGAINMIIGYPYTVDSIAVYNAHGKPTTLEIVK